MPRLDDNVTIGRNFAKKERDQAYSDVAYATIREHYTNADDAIRAAGRVGSGLIVCEIHKLTNDATRIVMADNGVGMDENTVRTKFMVLGETTKDVNGNQGGGFGRARVLTHFSQHKYHIYTRDLHVVGVGQKYIIRPNPLGYTHGCIMEVYVENKDKYGYEIDWEGKLREFLGHCQSPYTVVINGVEFNDWLYKRRVTRELPFANVHVNQSRQSSYVHVRVNGTCMFRQYVSGLKDLVILELNPETSRDMLTSNRDGFNNHYHDVFRQFADELTKDAKSAVEAQSNKLELVVGTGTFENFRDEASVVFAEVLDEEVTVDEEHSQYPHPERTTLVTNPMAELLAEMENVAQEYPEDVRERSAVPTYRDDSYSVPSVIPTTGFQRSALPAENVIVGDLRNDDYSPVETSTATEAPVTPKPRKKLLKTLRNRFPTILINDNTVSLDGTARKKAKKKIRDFTPDNWKVLELPNGKRTVTGGDFAKLLILWKTYCHFVVDEYLKHAEKDKIEWGVGWLFGDQNAEHRKFENRQWFLLNPLDLNADKRWSITKEEDRLELLLLAVHQVTHVIEEYHDSDFIRHSENLTRRVLLRMPEIRQAVKKIGKIKLAK